MYQTRKQLKHKIDELESELASIKQVEAENAFIKKMGLPKCESRICRGCAYASKEVTPWGKVVFQGCTKDLECKDFIPETKIVLSPNDPRLFL